MFTQYTIKDTDLFDELKYPLVSREVNGLRHDLRKIRSVEKTNIVISVLKDHCIKTEWLDRNTQLAKLLTSGSLSTSQIESLFSSCKHNVKFTSGVEAFIAAKLHKVLR